MRAVFDQVSVREWILLAILFFAYQPAQYLFRHVMASPSRRDITLPAEDLSWRTPSQFRRSLALLAGLMGLSIFVYTPAAAQLARSPEFFPLAMFAAGAWALFSVQRGFATGTIQPFLNGIHENYERALQPKRFWASLAWNALVGGFIVWAAYRTLLDAPRVALRGECFDDKEQHTPDERISACTELIADQSISSGEVEDYLSNRGIAHYRRGDYKRALADYDEAIRREPDDATTLYNRGLVHEQQGNVRAATADFSAAIRLTPKDMDAYFRRGLIHLDTAQFDAAIADFSQAHRLEPDDAWPLANRGIAFAWKKDVAQARRDFAAVRAIDATNPVLLRGEALLAMQAGEYDVAVQRLTAALNRDPKNAWSFRVRADAYDRLGEEEKRDADLDRLWELRTKAGSQ